MHFTDILCICIGITISIFIDEITSGKIAFIILLAVLLLVLIATLTFIYLQPSSGKKLAFSVYIVFVLIILIVIDTIMLCSKRLVTIFLPRCTFLGAISAIFTRLQYSY